MRAGTVVVVTQNARMRAGLRSTVPSGWRVISVASGIGALLACAAQPVDFVVLDRDIAGMDAPRLMQKLSAAFPALTIVEPHDVPAALENPSRKQPVLAYAAIAATQRRA